MRLLCILSPFIFMVFITSCQTGPSETDKQIIETLNKIDHKLDSIELKIKVLEGKIADDESIDAADIAISAMRGRLADKGPDILLLRKIKLPQNASREQIKDYIHKIINVSRGQTSYSTEDPQVVMLRNVGSENIDLLFPYMEDHYVQYVMPSLVTEKDKKKILKALKLYPQLISSVVRNNWTKDAKETIFEKLKYNTEYLPNEWINAAAQLASPNEYETLEGYFKYSCSPENYHNALMQLEDFDLKKAVAEAWAYKKRAGNKWSKMQMAIIAAKYGHKDALKYLVDIYPYESNRHFVVQIQGAFLQLTGKFLSPKEMSKWYKKNQSDLIFDPEKGTYILKKK